MKVENYTAAIFKAPWLGYLLLFAAAFCHFPNAFHLPAQGGPDGAWKIALHAAFRDGQVFGQDFVFTYGPLGVLFTRLGFDGMGPWLIGYDLFWCLLLFWAMYLLAKQLASPQSLIVAALSVFAAAALPYQTNQIFLLAVLFLFFLFYSQQQSWGWAQLLLSLLAAVLFFTQVHVGIVVGALFLFQLLVSGIQGKQRGFSFLAGVCYLVLLVIFAELLNVDFAGYTAGAWQLISCYQDALVLSTPRSWHIFATTGLFLLYCGTAVVTLWKKNSAQEKIQCMAVGAFLFLLFKQSVVRSDFYHLPLFLIVGTLPVGLLFLFSNPERQKVLRVVLMLFLFFGLGAARRNISWKFVVERLTAPLNYLQEMQSGPGSVPFGAAGSLASRADFIPWIPHRAKSIDFQFASRPVPVSYAVCNKYLDVLNADYFRSARAPEQVLLSANCIDEKYCFFGEAQTKWVLASRYEVEKKSWQELLLRRKELAIEPIFGPTVSTKVNMGEWHSIEQVDGLLMSSIFVRSTASGEAVKFLYKSAPLEISFRLSDGRINQFRTAKPILQSGGITNKYIETLADLQTFVELQPERLSQVDAIRISSTMPWQYESTIEIVDRLMVNSPEANE